MSGGSFNYLYSSDFGQLADLRGTIERMADALDEYPGGERAAVATRALYTRMRELELRWESPAYKALRDVWFNVEWHHSGDYGRESVLDELVKYNGVLAHAVSHEAPDRHARAALTQLPGGAEAWPEVYKLVAGAVAAALAEAREAGAK